MTCARPIAELIDLHDRLSRDADRDADELRRRDRAIGRELQSLHNHPHAQVTAWLDRAGPPADSPGRRAAHAVRVGGSLLAAFGFVLGGAAAAGLLYYDGSRPVNVVHGLAVFVGAQSLLLVLLAVAACRPGGSLLGFSPAITAVLLRALPQNSRQALQRFIGWVRSNRRVYGRVYKWLILMWTQTFALAFNVGAVVAALYLVVFTDIAFAWSTTLDIDAATFHQITSTLATPWARWLPGANPSAAFVESTRYFRLHEGVFPAAGDTPAAFGGWWRFLVAAMVCYGLLPRVVTALGARWRFAAAARHAMLRTPGVEHLRDRLNHAFVVTQTTGDGPASPAPTVRLTSPAGPADGAALAINWSSVDIDPQTLGDRLQLSIDRMLHAGGANSLDDDARVIEQAADARRIVIAVRAFEPPMGEFIDFVTALRASTGDGKAIEVAPLGATPEQRDVWRAKLATVGDPWLSVREAA